MDEKEKSNKAKMIYGIIKGAFLSVASTALLLLAVSAAYLAWDISEETSRVMVTGAALFSVFISSLLSGRKMKKRGLILGAATGAAYSVMIYLTGISAFGFPGFTKGILFAAALFMLSGAVGGIFGVNIKGRKR